MDFNQTNVVICDGQRHHQAGRRATCGDEKNNSVNLDLLGGLTTSGEGGREREGVPPDFTTCRDHSDCGVSYNTKEDYKI